MSSIRGCDAIRCMNIALLVHSLFDADHRPLDQDPKCHIPSGDYQIDAHAYIFCHLRHKTPGPDGTKISGDSVNALQIVCLNHISVYISSRPTSHLEQRSGVHQMHRS